MVQRVSDFKSAIGHIGSTWNFGPESKLKVISVDGYRPTTANLRSRQYPFFRNLSAVTDQQPSEDVLTIIREVQGGPAFDAVAKMQGEKGAVLSIHYALEAEKIHEAMYGEAKALVENGQDRQAQPVYICPMCGYTVIGDPPAKCPVSQTASEKFVKF